MKRFNSVKFINNVLNKKNNINILDLDCDLLIITLKNDISIFIDTITNNINLWKNNINIKSIDINKHDLNNISRLFMQAIN